MYLYLTLEKRKYTYNLFSATAIFVITATIWLVNIKLLFVYSNQEELIGYGLVRTKQRET